ncbi:MAG TPA: hypothetical protein ENJ19_08260 [Gammaproteobacteria bacterium]|nr:hypothetical protein [Gammaproteobacteria bacterium]
MDTNTALSAKGAWQIKAPVPGARSHTPPAVYGGKIYVFGGGGPAFASMNSVYAYDPARDSWKACAPMPTHRSGTVSVVVGDYIYVMGGGFKQANGQFRFLTKVEIYHPPTDAWETGPDLLQPHDYPAVALLDHAIYVLGGHHPDATTGGPKTDPGFDFCERLDLDTGKWSTIAPLSQPRFALSAVTADGKILALGGVAFTTEGFNNFTLVESYDPATNQWQREDRYTLPWPAAGQASCTLGGYLYLFGGYSTDNIHARAARLNLSGGVWERLPDMPAPRAAMGLTVLDETIYLIGGWADDGRTPQDSVFAYTVS